MKHYFLNDDHTYRPCTLMEWAKQMEDFYKQDKKHVGYDDVNGYHVSTVWLGLDHNFGVGEPLLFETMVFPYQDGIETYTERYTTWDEAVAGHERAIQWVLDGCKEDSGDS